MTESFAHGYALLIGVGQSACPGYSLPVTVKDVTALQAILSHPALCGYPATQIRLLTHQQATRQGILDGLDWLKQQATHDPAATIVVYYSGHGGLDQSQNRYYLLQHDISPSDLFGSALAATELTAALQQIPAERLLVIIDSCHAEGMAIAKADEATLDLPADFIAVAPSKGLFDPLSQQKGRAVFTSCAGTQQSWIRKDRTLSIFTHHLIEALQGAANQPGETTVKVSHLMNHLGRTVAASAMTECRQAQDPQFDFKTEDFAIALLQGGKGLPTGGWEAVKQPTDTPNLSAQAAGDRSVSVIRNVSSSIVTGDGNKIHNTKVSQHGNTNIHIHNASNFSIGDTFCNSPKPEAMQTSQGKADQPKVIRKLLESAIEAENSVDELVQRVRLCLHDDIQCWHGTMPLWGVDHWVSLGDLFVDVNILEELSSSHRAEIDDLYQDYMTGRQRYSNYRSLDRIGLGKEQERVSGLEVLVKNTNLMVVGKPGSGKTTYLQRVVTECNAGNLQPHRIPALIRLRDFVEDGRSLSYSLEQYLQQYWQLSTLETKLVLNQGRSLILLDGLDEVIGEDGKAITKQIKQFARTYPQVQIVVTCRTQSFSGEMDWKSQRFSFVEVADFNEEQVRSFAEHWFKAVRQDETVGLAKAQEFLEQLFREENKPIQELATTPILLSLTCTVFYQTGKFYSKRSELYEEGLDLLLEQWDKSREIERDEIYRDLSIERKLELLSYLAVKKFEQEQYVLFEQAEIKKYIAEFLQIDQRESEVVLRAIEAQHGLLIERLHRVWSFSHLTFQEYLVAKWFNKSKFDWENLSLHIAEYHWIEVFLLFIEQASTSDAYHFLHLMKNQFDEWVQKEIKPEDTLRVFLNWVRYKTDSMLGSYRAVAIRAFYFELGCGRKVLEETGKLRTLLGLSGAEVSGYKNKSKEVFFVESVLNTTLEILKIVSSSIMFDRNLIVSDYLYIYRSNDFVCVRSKDLQDELQALQNQLLKLKLEINDYSGQLQFIDDAAVSIKVRILQEELREVMLKYLRIGHSWNFSEKQKELLNQYYKISIILVKSLRVNSSVYAELKNTIEEELLLPIAEIEKRKRKKAELG